jgi:hypothetical protein
LLGHFERVDELHVVEQRSFGLIQQPSVCQRRQSDHESQQQQQQQRCHSLEDHVFELHEFVLVGSDGHDQAVFVLLELGLLVADHNAEQLGLEALLFDREVDDVRFGGDLGRIVRVAQLGRHVEAEVLVVLDLAVTQLQIPHATCGRIRSKITMKKETKLTCD